VTRLAITSRRAPGALLAVLAIVLPAGCGDSSSTTTTTSPDNAGLSAAAASASEAGPPATYDGDGALLADSGFRPELDGFGFENYGPGYQDLTPAEMVDLFGPKVCASGSAASCVLTPPAESWMSSANRSMRGGHCFGFSVSALMIFEDGLDPLQFGAPLTPQLGLDGNIALQGQIAETMALQSSPQVQRAMLQGPPNAVLKFLRRALERRGETWTIGMFDSPAHRAGHAVTPYGIEDRGDGQYAVLIYDNNYPGITRAIDFDTRRNAWSYEASPNPDVASYLFHGRGSVNPLILIPTGPAYGVQPCPFCRRPGQSRAPRFFAEEAPAGLEPRARPEPGTYEEVSLIGDSINHGHLVITDGAGRRTGFVDGELVNEIPGVQVIAPLLAQNFKEAPEPTYQVPLKVNFTVALDGSDLEAPDAEAVSIVGPGYSAVAGNIDLQPDQRVELRLSGDGTTLSYRAGAGEAQSPQLQIGVQQPGGDYAFSVATPPLDAGSEVTTVADPDAGRLTVDAGEVEDAGRYGLVVKQLRPSGSHPAKGRSVRVRGGGSAEVALQP
jgi:hypothetical protein